MTEQGLRDLFRSLPLVSSHTHHNPIIHQEPMGLAQILSCSYAGWCGQPVGTTLEEHAQYLDHVQTNTYFVWLSRAISHLYGQGEVSIENWEVLDATIRQAHGDKEHPYRILRDFCRFEFDVIDVYWNPGDDLGRPDIFRPSYRINSWVMCPGPEFVDHNNTSPWKTPDFAPNDLSEYLDALDEAIVTAMERGVVALKSALAYDRKISFDNPDYEAAQRAFGKQPDEVSPADREAFGDVVMHHICQQAAQHGLPFQVHLGLGILSGSQPMNFEPLIAKYKDTVFDLFHCGYPWLSEVAGLLHNYQNVVADLCWVPLISTTAAVRVLHEYLDVACSSSRIVWGDDTWTAEEAFGSTLAFEHVLVRVLSERIRDGLCTTAGAEKLMRNMMYENARKLFSRAD